MNKKLTPEEAQRLTDAEFDALLLSDHYDLVEVYEREIAPLLEQINEIVVKHDIPMLASFAVKNDGNTLGVMTSAHFNGPERTPTSFAVAKRVIYELDQNQAFAVMGQIDFLNQMAALGQTRN